MTILEEAQQVVGGDRQQDYGAATESFGRIAALWSAYKGVPFTSKDVGLMMILMKVSRAKHSDKRDTLVDLAGYAQCLDVLAQPQPESHVEQSTPEKDSIIDTQWMCSDCKLYYFAPWKDDKQCPHCEANSPL